MKKSNFFLDKWFLDFTAESGEIMIFYAAKLRWFGLEVPYFSRICKLPGMEVAQISRYKNVNFPTVENDVIFWNDPTLNVSGEWKAAANSIRTKLFESPQGSLDWHCRQPASCVQLKMNDQLFSGTGYAEQLTLTVAPWKIPMNELRWGRFVSEAHSAVWVELRDDNTRKWLWFDGNKIEHPVIEDGHIKLGDDYLLELDREVILETEKKIFNVVENLVRYLPGFRSVLPLKFLMADESKWCSNAVLKKGGVVVCSGKAIHELVNFNPEIE